MSLLTINKLTEAVGAEVLGVDADRMASDESLAPPCSRRSRTTACWCSRARAETRSAGGVLPRLGEVDHSSDGHHPVAGIYPSRSTSPRTPRRRICAPRSTGISTAARRSRTPSPRWPPCSRRSRSPNAGGRPSSRIPSRLRSVDRQGERAIRRAACRAFAGGVAAARHTRPHAGGTGALAGATHARAPAGMDASQRAQVAGAGGVGRLRRRDGSRRRQGAAVRSARSGDHARQCLPP